jgi:hypothetical protein
MALVTRPLANRHRGEWCELRYGILLDGGRGGSLFFVTIVVKLDDLRLARCVVGLDPLVQGRAACKTRQVGPGGVGRDMTLSSGVRQRCKVGSGGRSACALVTHGKRGMAHSVASILIRTVGVNDTMDNIILARTALLLSLIEEHLLMIIARNEQ